jgi:hypothetical protein
MRETIKNQNSNKQKHGQRRIAKLQHKKLSNKKALHYFNLDLLQFCSVSTHKTD